ncbi:hypothetical protein CCL14_21175, partial [Pseudomonas syringae]
SDCLFRPTQNISTIVETIVPHAPRGNAGLDALRRKEDAERPERHDDAERRTIVADYRSLRSSVGMQIATRSVAR